MLFNNYLKSFRHFYGDDDLEEEKIKTDVNIPADSNLQIDTTN